MIKNSRFLPWRSARQITGHATDRACREWVARWNAANPEHRIRRRYGAVEEQDLLAALEAESSRYDAGCEG